MPHSKNQLLARLGAEQLAQFSSHLKVVALDRANSSPTDMVTSARSTPLGDHLLHR